MSDQIGSLYALLDDIKKPPEIYSKIALTNLIKKKLMGYQEHHVAKLISILVKHHVALDASDTGIGKTYVAAAVCKELGKIPIIICPKTLIFNWKSVLAYFDVKAYDIVNYETIKNGKTYCNEKCKTRRRSPYINILESDPENPSKFRFEWNLPDNAIVIFDEAHRCKDPATDNGKLLISTKQLLEQNIPVFLLSATICEKFTDMKIPFYLFNLIENLRNYKRQIILLQSKYPHYRVKRAAFKSQEDYIIAKDNSYAMMIYEEIKDYTSRIKIKDLGDKFPKNQWCANAYITDDADEISKAYEEIAELMQELKDNPGSNHLAKIQKLKQEIEFKKIPIFIKEAEAFLEEGKSVIIFVNYLNTLEFLSNELSISCKIHGSQTMEERQEAIDAFQSNKERIIICQIRAGGVGISLHDLHGGHPRATLINYPDSASDLLQALGRAPRSGAKTPVLQRIIFAANVEYEKKIMQNINKKLANISAINDGDLDGYKYHVVEQSTRSSKKVVVEV